MGVARGAPSVRSHDWFLGADERGNGAARLGGSTEGNLVRALVHGRSYFPVLAEALERVGAGDLVLFADWRADPDERLTDAGPTVAQALGGAARRGDGRGVRSKAQGHS